VILELIDEEAIHQFNASIEKILSLKCRGLIITTKGKNKYDFVSRYFAPQSGINEDPVTGSAHCKLADFWQKKLKKNKFLAYQASRRGGELRLEIKAQRLLISGKAVTVSSITWLV